MRSIGRRAEVRLYPVRSSPERKRFIFLDMMQRAGSLEEHPEFYNLFANNCMNNVTAHIRRLGGRELRQFTGHTAEVTSVAFTPDGRQAVSRGWDGSVRVWELASGKELRRLAGPAQRVLCLTLAPGGRRALTGGEDGVLRLWELGTGKESGPFKGHRGEVTGVALARDGRRALSVGEDLTLRLWDVPK